MSSRGLPSGTVTFLFPDVEGATRLLGELGADWAEIDDIVLDPELNRRAGDLSQLLALTGGDAVHLATAEAVIDTDDFVACTDARLANGARALDLAVAGAP